MDKSRADIFRATSAYEAWLAGFMPIVRADLADKHRLMRSAPFPFMRATFYRHWPRHFYVTNAAADLMRQ